MDGRTPISGESAEPALDPSVEAPPAATSGFAPNPRALSGIDVLRLQRTAGNAAVARMLHERRVAREEAETAEADTDGGADEAPEGTPAPEEEADDEAPEAEEAAEEPPPRADPPEASATGNAGAAQEEDEGEGGEPLPGEPPQTGPPEEMAAATEAEAKDEPEEAPPGHAHAHHAIARRPAPPDTNYAPPGSDSGGGSGAAPGGPTHGPPPGGSRVGIVSEDRGEPAKLRKGPSTNSQIIAPLGFNTRVFITGTRGDWFYVTTAAGQFGYIYTKLVKTNLPEPSAKLYRIAGGDSAIGIAEHFYGKLVKPGEDLRFFVNVLEYVNRGRGDRGIYQPNPGDHSRGAWKNVLTRSDFLIWVPGGDFAKSLKGIVSSGSLTGGAWARARTVIKTIEDFAIGGAAFVAGLLEGAIGSVKDLLTGLGSLVATTWKIIKSLFQGHILRDAKHLWDTLLHVDAKEIAEDWIHDFVRRWTDEDIWTRWKFRGWVAGYAIAEVAMIILTDGGSLAVKLAGKAGKLGSKLVGFVKDFAPKVPKSALAAIKSRLLIRKLVKQGLSKAYVKGLSDAEREAVDAALNRWNIVKGKNQGVTHIVDYASGGAGAQKTGRLEILEKYNGIGPFKIKDPDLIPKVTDALGDLTRDPHVHVANPGDLTVYWIPRNNLEPERLANPARSSTGTLILKYQGKYSTFHAAEYRRYLKLASGK